MGVQGGGRNVQLSPAARRLYPPIKWSVNHWRASLCTKHYEQATGHNDYEPLLVIKQNRSKPLASSRPRTLLRIL